MTRDDLEELEAKVMKLLVQRRALGGFDTNAEAVLVLTEAMMRLIMHIKEKTPRTRKNKNEE